MPDAPPKLVQLYKDMAELTAPECAHTCRVPFSCCDEFACHITKEYALEKYGVTLKEYPASPRGAYFLDGDKGCTVPPHMRPHCTLHTCQINGLGFKPGDAKWTRRYFKLRGQLNELEMQNGDL